MAGAGRAPRRQDEIDRQPEEKRQRVTSLVFRRSLRIEWGHCDPLGIVFNPHFFEFFDTSSWMLFEAALGLKACDLSATYGIIGIALVDARAEFRKAVKFGDTIEIASRVAEFRRSSFDIEHRLTVGGEPAVEGLESRVWAIRDRDNPDKLATLPIPPAVIAKFG
jgi:4-hydroxybenzoyl-CoA thioesterase